MANERRGRERGVCVWMRDRWVGESDWRWKAMLGDVVGTRVRGGKSVTRCRSDSENVESNAYISSPNAWTSVTTKNENETTKKKLEEIDVGICVLSLSLADFLPAPLLVPDNQTTLLLTSSGPNKDGGERISHCRTNMSSALSVFLRGCQHLSKKRWRYWSNHKPSSHGARGTLAVGVPDTTAISELGQEGS